MKKAFTLIELLIVVAIILALAAMAIPNLLRSKMSANEASAVSSLHAIANAQTTYQVTYPHSGFADELTKLAYPAGGPALNRFVAVGSGGSKANPCVTLKDGRSTVAAKADDCTALLQVRYLIHCRGAGVARTGL